MSKYPNLTAEYETQRDSGCSLRSLAFFARVSTELLNRVFYDDVDVRMDVSFDVAISLFRSFRWNHRSHNGLTGFSMGYLFSPVLSLVEPEHPKTLQRRLLLKDRLSKAIATNPAPVSWLYSRLLANAQNVAARMDADERITYAEYRCAVCGLDALLDAYSGTEAAV